MQHRLLELLEIAIIEGNAGERSSHILQSLDNATAEVPFFDSPVPSSSGKSSTGVMGRTFGGKPSCVKSSMLNYLMLLFEN